LRLAALIKYQHTTTLLTRWFHFSVNQPKQMKLITSSYLMQIYVCAIFIKQDNPAYELTIAMLYSIIYAIGGMLSNGVLAWWL